MDATLLFYAFAAVAVVSALGAVMITRDTVAAALSLVVTMVSLAAVYLLLEAYLLAALQIIVYCGSIAVISLFAVMLTGVRSAPLESPGARWLVGAGVVLAVVFVFQLTGLFTDVIPAADAPGAPAAPDGYGGYRALGLALYTDYLLLVEATGLLLLAAFVGALVLAKRDLD